MLIQGRVIGIVRGAKNGTLLNVECGKKWYTIQCDEREILLDPSRTRVVHVGPIQEIKLGDWATIRRSDRGFCTVLGRDYRGYFLD